MRYYSDILAGYEPRRKRIIHVVTSILIVIGILAGVVILLPQLGLWNGRILSKLALLSCTLLPPVWFWYEFAFIWAKAPENARPRFELFRYGQEISRNVWLAYVAILVAIYFN